MLILTKWLAIVLFAAVISLLFYSKLVNDPRLDNLWLNLRPLLILLVVFLLMPAFYPIFAARAYKNNPTLHREISVDFNEERYEADDGVGAKTSMTWDYYDRFLEGKRVFVIRSLSKTFAIVSKTGMSDEEVIYIRGLLARCICRH